MKELKNIGADNKARFEEAIKLGQEGQLDEAAGVFASLAKEFPDDYGFLIEAGRQLEYVRRFGKAQEVYARAMQLEPDNYLTYAKLGALYVEIEKYPIAIKNLEHAVELAPEDADLHYNLALAYLAVQDLDRAITELETTLSLGGRAHLAFGTLSRIYEQTNQMDKLQGVLDVALEHFPDDPFLNFNAGVLERRNGNFEKALAHLDKCLSPEAAAQEKTITMDLEDMKMAASFEYGRIYDKLGDYDKAFKAFIDGNKFSADNFFLQVPNKDEALENVAKLRELDLTGWSKTTADPLAKAEKTPIFLVGFPRSGTTLLHQVLDGHSRLEVIEEKPLLSAVSTHIEQNLGGFPGALTSLDTKTFNTFRDEYMGGLKKMQDGEGDVRFVDKLPLHIIKVPLIKKMFPDAKFILALRHPCDSTLSCFMQNFGLNNAMMNFLSLDDATRYYDQVFSLWLKYVDKLDLDYTQVRYEDVVTDLEKEARSVISFLGLPWEDGVLQYREQAKAKKRISTPSYSQVVQPIYTDASGRWKRYEKYLEPYLDRLAPYCEAFGYSL